MKPTHIRSITEDKQAISEVFDNLVYFPNWFDFENKSINIIIDVGAHLGSFTLFAQEKWPDATIYSFEPDPHSFDLLKKNTYETKSSKIKIHNSAIWSDDGTKNLNQFSETPGCNSIVFSKPPHAVGGKNIRNVNTVSIKKILDSIDGQIDLIKLDCEGSEYAILYSLLPSELKKIQFIVLEYHEFDDNQKNSSKELSDFLRKNGFTTQIIPTDIRTKKSLGYIYAANTKQTNNLYNKIFDNYTEIVKSNLLHLESVEKNLSTLQKEFDERSTWALELNSMVTKRDETINHLQQDLTINSAELNQLNSQLNKAVSERDQLKSQVEKAISERTEIKSQLDKVLFEENQKIVDYEEKLKNITDLIQTKNSEIELLQNNLYQVQHDLEDIQKSIGYKTGVKVFKFLDKIFPPDSRGGKFLRLSRVSIAIIQNQGFGVFFQAFKEKMYVQFNRNKIISNLNSNHKSFSIQNLNSMKDNIKTKIILPDGKIDVDNRLRENLKIGSSNIYNLSKMPKVSIIIATFNQTDLLKKNIVSIERSTYKNYEIIIVTNNLDENSDLRKFLKEINHTVLIYDDEYSFSSINNFASKKSNGEFLLFLNDDVEIVSPSWLESMLKLGLNEEVGAVGAKILFPDGKLQEAGCIMWKNGAWNYGRNQDPEDPNFNFVRDVDYCSASCLMVKKKIFLELDGFDNQFKPAYCEDNDLCLAIYNSGYRVLYQPLAKIIHHEGSTSGKDIHLGIKKYQLENEKKLRKKWDNILKSRSLSSSKNVFVERNRRNGANILYIDHYVPEYDKDAGSLTTYYLSTMLSLDGNKVTFWPDNLNKKEPYVTELQQKGIEVVYGPNNFESFIKERGWSFQVCFMARPHISKKYIDIIRKHAPYCQIVYDTHDLHYLRELREAELFKDAKKHQNAIQTKSDEFDIITKSDFVLVRGMSDAKILVKEIPTTKIAIIPPLQIPYENPYSFEQRKDLLFLGGFQHTPNVDSLNFLLEEIMPYLRKKLPDITLVVIGSNPPASLVEKCKVQKNVKFLGFVENIDPYLNQCKILLAPLRYGAGVKGKITQGLAYGIPIVTTSIGAESITENEEIMLISDIPQQFANKVATLYNDQSLWDKISSNGRKFAEKNYSPEVTRNILIQILKICQDKLNKFN